MAMLRSLAFLALVSGAGLGAWNSFQKSSQSPLDWAVGEIHALVTQHNAPDQSILDWIDNKDLTPEKGDPPLSPDDDVERAQPASHSERADFNDRFTVSEATLAAITCGPWDVSEAGIEAILQEMIRRGWTPPNGAQALAASRSTGGAIRAVDPGAPASVATLEE
jgi:hypothetical protein